MRNSASEAVITMTNGVPLRASPGYLPITVIGMVASRDVLTINIYILRFLNRTRWQSKGLLEGGGGQGEKATSHLSDFPQSVSTEAGGGVGCVFYFF